MSSSADAAEQVVRMSLNGIEIAAKISGKAAERLAVLLYAVLKDQKRTKGKIRLTNMLKSGKELKVFAVRDSELAQFGKAAKQYGVLYCVLKDRKNETGLTDVMVRADDAGKINRIFERFNLATIDMASVKTEIEKAKAGQEPKNIAGEKKDEKEGNKESSVRGDTEKEKLDQFMEKVVVEKNPEKEEEKDENPKEARSVKSSPSGPLSEDSSHKEEKKSHEKSCDEERMEGIRPSVRKEMKEIREEQMESRDSGKTPYGKDRQVINQHKAPKRKSRRKEKV